MSYPQDAAGWESVRLITLHIEILHQKRKQKRTNKHHPTGHRWSLKKLLTCEQAALECLCIPVKGYSHQEGGNERENCTSPLPTYSSLKTLTYSSAIIQDRTSFISKPLPRLLRTYLYAVIRLIVNCCSALCCLVLDFIFPFENRKYIWKSAVNKTILSSIH